MSNGTMRDYAVASTLHILDLERELKNCNSDKAALRQWYRDMRAIKK